MYILGMFFYKCRPENCGLEGGSNCMFARFEELDVYSWLNKTFFGMNKNESIG